MNAYISEKIKVLSLLAIWGVLFIHSQVPCSLNSFAGLFQNIIVGFSRFAVPFFFVISGFLFFLKGDSLFDYFLKQKKRIRTLLLPYLCWCLIFILIIFFVNKIVELNSDYFMLLNNGDYFDFFKYVFLTPAAFHLWYIRDLMVLVVISPLIGYFLRKNSYITLSLGLIFTISFWGKNFIPSGVLFYCLGAYYAIKKKYLFGDISNRISIILLLGASVVIVVTSYMNITINNHVEPIITTMLVIGLWGIYNYLDNFYSRKLLMFADCTFFIYCAHIPLLMIIKKILYPTLISGEVGVIICFVLSPLICMAVLLWISGIARKKLLRYINY